MDLAKIRKKHKKTDEPAEGKGEESPSPGAVAGFVTPDFKSSEDMAATLPEPAEPAVVDMAQAMESVSSELLVAISEQESERVTEFIVFPVGDEEYAFGVDDVAEILKEQIITFVPRAKAFVIGVTSMSGKIIPVLDPAIRLCVPEPEPHSEDRKKKRKILIIKGAKGQAGILIYGAMNVIGVPDELIQPPPAHMDDRGRMFVEAVLNLDGRFISVLRTDDFLNF